MTKVNEATNIFRREAQTIGESLRNIRGLSALALEETKIIADSLRNLRQIPDELKQKFDKDIEMLPDDIGLSQDITNDRPDLSSRLNTQNLDSVDRQRPSIGEHDLEGL